jgi:UDP-N-acetylglucosamine:LPS N-acetylglucosamine transferase
LQSTPKLDFVYFDAGGGHRSAAMALESVIASEGNRWNVRLVNLQEVLDELDVFRKVTGIRLQDIYNLVLAKGWTLGSRYLLPLMHGVIRLYHSSQVRLLTAFWREQRPDMVVSLVPNFNRALYQSLQRANLDVPFVTVLTDLADYPPHFWIEKGQQQWFVCGSSRAADQAARCGHPPERIVLTSGMILRPDFYKNQTSDRGEERRRRGLDPGLPTGLVMFGGEGSNVMFRIAERLGNSSQALQLIMICGRNRKLQERLQKLTTRNRIFVEGFTKDIPDFMHLSDFFVGKPGPGSISEALKMGLPVILERNAWTLPQERYNADWVREQGAGIVLKNFRNVDNAVKALLHDGRLGEMRRNIARMNNRAVFEIPAILERIYQSARQPEIRIS